MKKILEKIRTPDELQKLLEDAWLNIVVDETKIYNPLLKIPEELEDKPHLYITWLMSQPEYFSFTCRELLGIEILPFQGIILNELWQRKFPMLIASRGASKSFSMALYAILRMMFLRERKIIIAGSGFRQSKIIYNYMETILSSSPILKNICQCSGRVPISKSPDEWVFRIGDSYAKCIPIGDGCLSSDTVITYDDSIGYINRYAPDSEGINKKSCMVWNGEEFTESDESYNNNIKPVIKITTKKGYTITGTHNHKLIFYKNGLQEWRRLDNVKIGDIVPINKRECWHNGDNKDYSELDCYILGLMIGDGSWINQYYLQYTTKDQELINVVNDGFGVKFKKLDEYHYKYYSKLLRLNWLGKWNMESSYTIDKKLPSKLLSLSKRKVAKCISGLFDTDGTVQINTAKGGYGITISFTNTSKDLIYQLQTILLKYGIISTVKYRDRNDKWNRVYELYINGKNVLQFHKEIGFGLKRKQEILEFGINKKTRWVTQEKYDEDLFLDSIVKIEYDKLPTFDIHVPDGHTYEANGFISHNSKARGQRANDVFTDEFASIPIEIFETVLAGFGAVSSAPKDNVKQKAKEMMLAKYSLDPEELKIAPDPAKKDNQIIIAGTAYYDFNHFAQYHKRWTQIVKSRGDKNKLASIFGEEPDKHFDWRHYSVIRFPWDLLPDGFMDESQIARSKSTMSSDNFMREFGCVFSKDSNGFFSRLMIEKCVVQYGEGITFPNGYVATEDEIFFEPKMFGDRDKDYIIAIDPASMLDNFAIVVLELNANYRKIVHVWTTNDKDHKERLKLGLTKEHNFYAFATRKIRDLMRSFNTVRIAIDSEGGGREIMGQLKDRDKLRQNELPIYRIRDLKKPNPEEDGETGLHIIEEIHFSSAEWTTNANHGLKKDFEDRVLLFPYIDGISMTLADFEDDEKKRDGYDNLAQLIKDIEELKNELSSIVVTETPSGRERWDTPETKTATGKKGRMRKDRYSALLMANASARNLENTTYTPLTFDAGGFAQPMKLDNDKPLFMGPSHIISQLQDLYS